MSSFGNNSSGGAFGGGASSGFGSGGAGGFGRSNTTMQGLDTLASGGLGRSSPQQSAFGQQPKTQVGAFGGCVVGLRFRSGFGQSSTGGFGSTNSGGFGSSNSSAPVSGGFGQSNGGAFGQSPGGFTGGLQGTGSPFGAQNQQQNAFGATQPAVGEDLAPLLLASAVILEGLEPALLPADSAKWEPWEAWVAVLNLVLAIHPSNPQSMRRESTVTRHA